jgi:hypothetical protein
MPATQPSSEEGDDPLGDVGQCLHAGGALGPVRERVERRELGADIRARRPGRRRRGAGRTSGSARSGRDRRRSGTAIGWPLTSRSSTLAGELGQVALGRRLDEPALQDRGGHRDLGSRALLGQEHPEDRTLEGVGGVTGVGSEAEVDAVVREHPLEPVAELGRQCRPLGIQRLQVGVEVLARGVDTGSRTRAPPPRGRLRLSSAKSAKTPSRATSSLIGDAPDASISSRALEVAGERALLLAGVEVVAQEHPARSARPRAARSVGSRSATSSGRSRSGAVDVGGSPASAGSPVGSRRTRAPPVSTWLPAATSSSLTRPRTAPACTVSIFIDSRTSTGAPAATSSPTATGVATTRAGAGRTHHAALVAADPVGDAVDLDELHRTVGGGDESVGTAAHDDPARGIGAAAGRVGLHGDGPVGSVTATRNRAGPVRKTVTL